jgi:hypothetical protein
MDLPIWSKQVWRPEDGTSQHVLSNGIQKLSCQQTFADIGTSDDNVPVNVMQLQGCQRRLAVISRASDDIISPKSAIWDEGCEAIASECLTTMGELLCEKCTASDENGRDDIAGLVGAARDS